MYYFVSTSEIESKYYDCYKNEKSNKGTCLCDSTLKAEYIKDLDLTANSLTEDYVAKLSKDDVTCSDSEKKDILNIFKNYLSHARVPESIESAMSSRWAQRKYYNCNYQMPAGTVGAICGYCNGMTLKKEIACHPEKFPEQFLKDWQEQIGITLTKSEQNEILNKAKEYAKKLKC